MANESWSNEVDGWLDRAEALEALRLCRNMDAPAVLLVDREGDGAWEEATEADMENDACYAWQIMDEGGNVLLVPESEADEGDDDLDVPVPPGFLWIVP